MFFQGLFNHCHSDISFHLTIGRLYTASLFTVTDIFFHLLKTFVKQFGEQAVCLTRDGGVVGSIIILALVFV